MTVELAWIFNMEECPKANGPYLMAITETIPGVVEIESGLPHIATLVVDGYWSHLEGKEGWVRDGQGITRSGDPVSITPYAWARRPSAPPLLKG